MNIERVDIGPCFEKKLNKTFVITLCCPVKRGLFALVNFINQVPVVLKHQLNSLSLFRFDCIKELF